MDIIAIHAGHNANVGYFVDGVCKKIYHEEKFNNKKNHVGFPENALKKIYNEYNIKGIDKIIFGETEHFFLSSPTSKKNVFEEATKTNIKKVFNYLSYKSIFRKPLHVIRKHIIKRYLSPNARSEIEKWLLDTGYVNDSEKIEYIDHHTSHCVTPLYFYGLAEKHEEILMMSLDGAGDYSCSKVFKYNKQDKKISKIAHTDQYSSLGLFYAKITKFLGMKQNEHEYKVMGLAAYNTKKDYYEHIYNKLRKIVWVNKDTLTFESKFNTNHLYYYMSKEFVGERFDNIASAAQQLLNDLIIEWIEAAIEKTSINVITLSGGVFMNVKINQAIVHIKNLKNVYFQPSCGDESLVIGAASKAYLNELVIPQRIESMYLGHDYNNNEVEAFLHENQYDEKYNVTFHENIEKISAELLAKHEVIARVKGSGEWGARSLCNRGILANASDLKTFHEINDMIKMRDFWMPFAPTILDSWTDKYIEEWDIYKEKCPESMEYMIITCMSTEIARKHLVAAIHQKDKTLRPQVLYKSANPELYQLLEYYEQLTDMGGILNTSLNMHGYPLVGTLEQAMFTFENSGLKYITLENILVSKI